MQTVEQKLKAAGNIEANIHQIWFYSGLDLPPFNVVLLRTPAISCLGLLVHTLVGRK